MPDIASWIFVDDLPQEAQAFAAQFANGVQGLSVKVLEPQEARAQILGSQTTPLGVLMDVDLSAIPGELGTGPGIAQDIRVRQRNGKLKEFPIVRFSSREKVLANVRGDPTSSDLFDLKIEKEDLGKSIGRVKELLLGVRDVYDRLAGADKTEASVHQLLGVNATQFEAWGHQSLVERVLSGQRYAAHVAAIAVVGGVLLPPGLLINEEILSFRLGIDSASSGSSWKKLTSDFLSFRYKGAGAPHFSRWWARGLEDWWWKKFESRPPLSSLTIAERLDALKPQFAGLKPLTMPKGSAGDRPWRHCSLTLEGPSAEWIPVDPAAAVSLTPWADLPPWVDPQYASLSAALEEADPRANEQDMARLRKKYGG